MTWQGRQHSLPASDPSSPLLYFSPQHSTNNSFYRCVLLFLGVLVYEMVMASTPFAPKKADNVTELFTNIAMVTVSWNYNYY